ncbi:MAG: hypothetical protein P8L23_00575, partial [Flavobacteriales bacterium]|nr:hypothetical protein [Flavobacteriales bacterium]
FLTTVVFSQGNNDTYLGIGSGARKIAKSEKKAILPKPVDSTLTMEEVKYYLEPKKQDVVFELENISPARLKIVEPLDKLYSGYVKGGAGSYLTPYLEMNYGSQRSKYESWGVRGLTKSSLASVKEMGNTQFSEAELGGYFQKFFYRNDLWFQLDYKRDKYRFYGITDSLLNPELLNNDSSFTQRYHLVDVHAKFNSRNTGRDTAKVHYKTWFDYHFLNGQNNLIENHFLIGGHSGKFIKREEFLANVELDVNSLTQPTSMSLDSNDQIQLGEIENNVSAIARVNPHIYSRGKNWKAKLGLSIQGNIEDVAEFFIFPDVNFSYSLFNNVFIPYAGLTGNVQRNTWNSTRIDNPFISESSTLQNTVNRMNLYGGIRGSLSSSFTFNFKTAYERFKSFCMYVPDTSSSYGNKFNMFYDDVNRTTIMGEISYQDAEKLKISAKAEYFIYDPKVQEFAWQKPDFIFTISTFLDLSDKIIVKGDVFAIGPRMARVYSDVEGELLEYNYEFNYGAKKLPTCLDMNLGLEYRYNDRVSAFINFNNFTASKYQIWDNYPVQSINILGGVTFSF